MRIVFLGIMLSIASGCVSQRKQRIKYDDGSSKDIYLGERFRGNVDTGISLSEHLRTTGQDSRRSTDFIK